MLGMYLEQAFFLSAKENIIKEGTTDTYPIYKR